MLTFICVRLIQQLPALLLASLLPLLAFAGLVGVEQFLPSELEADSRQGFRWLLLVLAFFLPACHGFLWATTTAFLMPFAKRLPVAWHLSVPLDWAAVRSLWVSIGWTVLAFFVFVGAGMILVGLFAYKDPGELVSSTAQQAQQFGAGTRIAPQRGAGGQSVRLEDFHAISAGVITALCALAALWVWLKSLMCVPLRVLGQPITMLTALDSTAGVRGVRLTLWVALLGVSVYGLHWFAAAALPVRVIPVVDAGLFVLLFWIVGGMLAWHAQKFVASAN